MCAYGCVGKSVDVRVWVCNEWPCNINCILQAKVVLTGVVNRGPNLVWVFCLWGLYLCVCVARQLSLWMNSCTCVVHVWLCRCLCVKLPVAFLPSCAGPPSAVSGSVCVQHQSPALQVIPHPPFQITGTLQHRNTLYNMSFSTFTFHFD